MSPISFLLIAFVVALIGTLVVVAANRSPSRHDSAMTEFEREMRALAPRPPSSASTGRQASSDRGDRPPDAPASDDASDER